ncbi:MAG TPA: DUF4173 domain-containing protein [Pyrinomonadaceae bacterium]
MRDRTKLGLGVLEAALILGVLGDALLRATPWGLNVLLWMSAFALALLALVRRKGLALSAEGGWLLPSALFFAACFAWRDSPTLMALDVLTILTLTSLAALVARGQTVWVAGVTRYALSLLTAGFNAAFGSFALLLSDIGWKEIPRKGWAKHALAVACGLLIAVPLLVVFGALFMAADAVFEGIVVKTLRIDFEAVVTHAVLICFVAWTTGGYLRGAVLSAEKTVTARAADTLKTAFGFSSGESLSVIVPSVTAPPIAEFDERKTESPSATTGAEVRDATPGSTTSDAKSSATRSDAKASASRLERMMPSLGIIEIGTVLGLVNLLFFCFVAVQIRYFFGGAEWVASSAGMTYSEYARRGFFELVWVAALVLPLLLASHWLLRKENPAHERIFRGLAGVLVVLLFVIMVSAVRRMRLYQFEYGLTELRLYTTAFMLWLAVVFGWFAATVLRGRRERFASGALISALGLLAALHLLNPDDFIVRNNAELLSRGRAFDASYAASLSADAAPALVEVLPHLNADEQRRAAATRLLDQLAETRESDWRSWNWSRAEARRALKENEASLRETARDPKKELEVKLSNEALREMEGK